MKHKLLFGFTFLFVVSSFAQEKKKEEKNVEPATYKMAIGLKYRPQAISFKMALDKGNGIEANAYFYRGTTARLTVMYQHYMKLKPIPVLRWYFGGGVHISHAKYVGAALYNQSIGTGLGLDGCLGVDYKFTKYPINLSLDWQPSFNLVNGLFGDAGYGGLGIRYVIK